MKFHSNEKNEKWDMNFRENLITHSQEYRIRNEIIVTVLSVKPLLESTVLIYFLCQKNEYIFNLK